MRESLVELAITVYTALLPFAWIALAVCALVLLPMATISSSRGAAGVGFMLASWLFGLTTWTLGAAITFATFGWFGLIVGLVFFGIGVVPLAVLGAIFKVKSLGMAVSLIVMAIVTFVARGAGAALVARSGQSRAQYVP